MGRVAQLEGEVARLREALALERSKSGPASNDMGIAGRIAITRLADTDYPELVKVVDEIPVVFRESGRMAALAYCRLVVRSKVDAIVFSVPRTADLVRAQHRMHMMLSEGEADLLMMPGQVGERARIDLLEAVERHAFAPSVKASFAHGSETPAGLFPSSFAQGGR